jgi:hypothetical protein
MATAASQSASRASSWASPPASQSTPEATSQARTRWKLRRNPGSWPSAATTKMVRPTCIATYAPANSRPRSPNASGRVADMSRLASITPTSTSRTTRRSGSNQLVNQAL